VISTQQASQITSEEKQREEERIKKILLFNIQKQFAKFNQSRAKANIFTTLTFLLVLS